MPRRIRLALGAALAAVCILASMSVRARADAVAAHIAEGLTPADGTVYQVEGGQMYLVPAYTELVYVELNGAVSTQYVCLYEMLLKLHGYTVDQDNLGTTVTTNGLGHWERIAHGTSGVLSGERLMPSGVHSVTAQAAISAHLFPNGPGLNDNVSVENWFTIQIAH